MSTITHGTHGAGFDNTDGRNPCSNGITTQICYVHVRGQKPGDRIGMAHYLEQGYYGTNADYPGLKTAEEVDAHIDELNRSLLKIEPEVRYAMEIGSMMGWRVPGARPALEHFGAPTLV